MRIGFLFNHEGTHQIAHSLPIAYQIAALRPDVRVEVMVSSDAALAEVTRHLTRHVGFPPANMRIRRLSIRNRVLRNVSNWAGSAVPLERVAILASNLERFRALDALVVPEKTSLMLKTRFGLKDLKIIHTRHGAGDRAIGFDAASGAFDFVLLSGPKIRDRLLEKGLLREGRYAITGYAKFDLLRHASPPASKPAPLFNNSRPTVLYNPHPSPRLSSWYAMGEAVLEYFRTSTRYNLIFAPHVMLYRRRWSVTIAPPAIARVRPVPQRFLDCPHIHVDTGSSASVDMTYTRQADIYLGDASSQIYEFLVRPRPAVFLNPHGHDHAGNADFAHWQCGPVAAQITDLEGALEIAQAHHANRYRAVQDELFRYSFDLTEETSSRRAAVAILRFMDPQKAMPEAVHAPGFAAARQAGPVAGAAVLRGHDIKYIVPSVGSHPARVPYAVSEETDPPRMERRSI